MPRSYSFDHYQVPKTMRPQPPRGVRGKKKKDPKAATDVHYGKQFAQTEELYHAHEMEKQLEELAGIKGSGRMSRGRAEDPMDRMRKEAPIGAMPTAEPMEPSRIRDVWDEGVRYAGLLRDGVRDVSTAAMKLLRLPSDLVRAAIHRPRHA
ncbi:MAG: hypothetical protein ACJ790_03000 [Myxococcaceae bacterium]